VLTMLLFFVFAFIGVGLAPDGVPGAGAVNLAWAAALSISFLAFLMWFVLNIKLEGLEVAHTFTVGVRGMLAAAVAFGVAALTQNAMFAVMAPYDGAAVSTPVRLVVRLLIVAVGAAAGVAFFLIIAAMLRVQEIHPFTRRMTAWRHRGRFFTPTEGK